MAADADLTLDPLERIEIRMALEDLNSDFTHHLDHGAIEALVDLFTEDALSHRLDTPLFMRTVMGARRRANRAAPARRGPRNAPAAIRSA